MVFGNLSDLKLWHRLPVFRGAQSVECPTCAAPLRQEARWGTVIASASLLSEAQKQQIRDFIAGNMHNPTPQTPVVQLQTSRTALPDGVTQIGLVELDYTTKRIVRKTKRIRTVTKKRVTKKKANK